MLGNLYDVVMLSVGYVVKLKGAPRYRCFEAKNGYAFFHSFYVLRIHHKKGKQILLYPVFHKQSSGEHTAPIPGALHHLTFAQHTFSLAM